MRWRHSTKVVVSGCLDQTQEQTACGRAKPHQIDDSAGIVGTRPPSGKSWVRYCWLDGHDFVDFVVTLDEDHATTSEAYLGLI